MTDSTVEFNLNPEEKKKLSYEKESKQIYAQKEQDLVFQKGKAIKSKVMSSSIFNTTINQFGVDAAKTVILQELLKMSEDEIIQELNILFTVAESNQDIKRSLRAAKFMAVQWLEDEKRGKDARDKCKFIVETLPTFKTSGKIIEKSKPEISEPKNEISNPEVKAEQIEIVEFPEMKNRPLPPENPPEAPTSKYSAINKLARGESILIITDVQGDYNRLRDTLLKYNIVYQETRNKLKWNPKSKTKLVLTGDLFNKSPYSSWGGEISYQSFQVIELIRRLIGESGNNIFLCLGNYDLQICSNQIFHDESWGFTGKEAGIKVQAQAIPALISFIEFTAFDTSGNLYSPWQKEVTNKGIFFLIKPEFRANNGPDIRVKANEMHLPDITSLRSFLFEIYKILTLPKDKRPKTVQELDSKALPLLNPRPGEILEQLANSKERANLFEGILNGTKTIDFLKNFISSIHKFQNDRGENLKISHVSLQDDIAQMFEKAKENNWAIQKFAELFNVSKYLKVKKINPEKLMNDLFKVGITSVNELITKDPELIFDQIAEQNQLELFIPLISPNKLKFGFVKGIERLQDSLKQEDKTGLLGFRLVDRKHQNEPEDSEMKKIAELNDSAKKAYADKILTDIFGNSKGFNIKVINDFQVTCEKGTWLLTIDIDKTAALYEDDKKTIHVPIKHIAYLEFR